ncbi:MAG TPA: SNF2-related protein [Saprospiraceae bacterium]|nr:SNF2-related protein [Saprospiraceae bacterium]
MNSSVSPHQAKYFAYELTKRCPSDSVEKFSATLLDAQVDLNPHQVEAALFAFKSPLSTGAILADEVGLGKTIEAGILLSQKWAENNRKLIVICPSNLRKQWSQELEEKFFLPTQILELRSFNEFIKAGKRNPFEQPKVLICSYHFSHSKEAFLQLVSWDLVVIDEAHRLRNVHQPSNIIGKSVKNATAHARKVLLTATPLQNSLMELFGLVSIIDEHVFGDRMSFKNQFTRPGGEVDFQELRNRIAPVCHRTLRRQVQEYIRYTNRIPLTLRFEPTEAEYDLYVKLNEYLQRQLLFALPAGQRHLLTMIMRKLLASSSFAIAGTLHKLISRLELLAQQGEARLESLEGFDEDLDDLDDYLDEWEYADEEESISLSAEEIEQVKTEIEELKHYRDLAESIESNAKGEKLIASLREGLSKMEALKAPQKAIIFTESRRTQAYLFNLLEQTDFQGATVLFNGVNNDDKSKEIYREWLAKNRNTDRSTGSHSADMRAALVEYFRDEARIMIATEAAAEGINLQFCAMVVNYDLPWNPQRIEQRIGRCHRYGQRHDVVVVNFLNLKNAADQRVFQLLDEKFQLFSGVFGASDEVLGTIESGVDFEKKIAAIYQHCRSTEEINRSFDLLQAELEEQINNRIKNAREQLFEHFDAEVIDKLKVRLEDTKSYIGKYEHWLWRIALYALQDFAEFDPTRFMFRLYALPQGAEAPIGWYTLDKKQDAQHRLRIGHPLAQAIIEQAKTSLTPTARITFNYSGTRSTSEMLEPLLGQSGYLMLSSLTVHSFDTTDHLIFTARTQDGAVLSNEQCRRLMGLDALGWETPEIDAETLRCLADDHTSDQKTLLQELKDKDTVWFRTETLKLQKWADDRIYAAEKAIRDTKAKIRELERLSAQETNTETLLDAQKKISELKKKQRRQRTEIFDVEDEIEAQRDVMIREVEVRMQQQVSQTPLFAIQWLLL